MTVETTPPPLPSFLVFSFMVVQIGGYNLKNLNHVPIEGQSLPYHCLTVLRWPHHSSGASTMTRFNTNTPTYRSIH